MDVLVAKGAAPREIFDIETEMDSVPAIYIKSTVENTVLRGTVKRTMLIDLIKDISCSGRQLAIGQITKIGESEVGTEGTAVFRDGKIVGWLDPVETRGYLFATGKVKSSIINVPVENGVIAVEIIRSKGKVDVEFENGELSKLIIEVRFEANMGEYDGKGKLDIQNSLHKLEGLLSEEVKKEIKIALNKTQKDCASDIFGFGMQIHKYHSQYWKEAEDKWNDIFSKLPVDINVNAKIRRTGVIKNPIMKGG